jgi:RNA polymerase sigma-70 factor (ECF subfamily)
MQTSRSEAFVELVVTNQRRLYGYILTLLPDPNEASDVLQQTNVALWRDSHRFAEGTNFIAWAFRVAYFMVLEHREKSQRFKLRFSDTVLDNLAQEAQSFAEDDAARLSAMRLCVEQLPPTQQELVRRRYFEGEAVGGIAKSLGQTANALANSLYRIRRALWDCIHRRLTTEGDRSP